MTTETKTLERVPLRDNSTEQAEMQAAQNELADWAGWER